MFALNNFIYLEILTVIGLMISRACLKPIEAKDLWIRFAIAGVGLPFFAFFLPSLWMLHAVMFLVVPILARGSRSRIAPVYLFSLMLLPNFATDIAIGELKLWLHDLHVTLGLGALAALLMSGRRPHVHSKLDLPFLIILLLLTIGDARGTSATNFLRFFTTYALTYGVPYFVVSRSVRSQNDIKRIMIALASAGALLAVILVWELLRTWPMYRILYDHFGIPLTEGNNVKMRAGFLRAAGPFIEATSAAFVLVFCFVAGWLSKPAFRSKTHYLFFMAVLLVGLLPGQSRGAWIGAIVCVLAVRLFQGGVGKASQQIAFLAVGAALFLAATSVSSRIADFAGLTASGQATVDYRQQLFDLGMEQVRAHPLGQTSAQLMVNLSELKQGEHIVDFVNTYLFVALVAGIPGALIFFSCLVSSVMAMWRLPKLLRTPATAFIFAGTVAPIEMLAFTSLGGRAAIIVFTFMGLASVAGKLPLAQAQATRKRIAGPAPLQVVTA